MFAHLKWGIPLVLLALLLPAGSSHAEEAAPPSEPAQNYEPADDYDDDYDEYASDSVENPLYYFAIDWPVMVSKQLHAYFAAVNVSPSAMLNALDFSSPGDHYYGDDPRYEVFNPDGPIRAPVLEAENYIYITDDADSRFVFTMGNRVDDGAPSSHAPDDVDLMMVLRAPKKRLCEGIHLGLKTDIPDLPHPPSTQISQFRPAPEDVVTLPSRYGCVNTPDGLYYYFTLYERRAKKPKVQSVAPLFRGRSGGR